jgi:hypothetical protein
MNLTDEEAAYFERSHAAYVANMDWAEFSNLVAGSANPLVRDAGGRVTQSVWHHPLYQAVRDLEDRLGIRQGCVQAEAGDDVERDPLADEWISVSRAAEMKGVTATGLHKAIDRGDVIARPARPNGSWLVVSVRSLSGWTPDPVRQAARRKGVVARA